MIKPDNFYGERARNALSIAQHYPSRTAAAKALCVHRHTLMRWEAKQPKLAAPSIDKLIAHHRSELESELEWLRQEARVLQALVAVRQQRARASKLAWHSSDSFP